MRRLLPALALLASCSGGRRIEQPAVVTLFGPEARLETWEAEAAEGNHLHPGESSACREMEGLLKADSRTSADPRARARAGAVQDILEDAVTRLHGPACGGPGRLALALRRYAPGAERCDEAIIVTVPALSEDEEIRTFAAPDVTASRHRPPAARRAGLERGRVGVRRLGPRRYEFEIFLVLRSPAPSWAPLQVVARVEATAPPGRAALESLRE